METTKKQIDNIAIYLRKSRGDLDEDLDKHRLLLQEVCEKVGAKTNEYAEIGTSDSIEDRPAFRELLEDIKLDLFDAVAVVDIDRLGRGGDRDWADIEETFRDSEIYIITPEKIYSWDNDTDEMELDFRKFIARMEYKQTTKRLRRGKILGAKQGRWTNGIPPYPYVYNRLAQQLDVDEDKYKVYRQIIGMALDGMPANSIAWELNKLGIPSPRGSNWTNVAVYRLLKDQTHLGKIVFGKTEGSGHVSRKVRPLKMLPEDKWVIVDGLHKPVKTQEEHDKIMEFIAKRRIIPVAARAGAFTLSGLIYCSSCGYRMGITKNTKRDEVIKKCQKRDAIGNRTCNNSGIASEVIVDSIFKQLKAYEDELERIGEDSDKGETELLKVALKKKRAEAQKHKRALETLLEMREEGEVTRAQYIKRKELRERKLLDAKQEVAKLRERISHRERASHKYKIDNIKAFYYKWDKAKTAKERNQFLSTIIDRIDYKREGDNIDIHINFR